VATIRGPYRSYLAWQAALTEPATSSAGCSKATSRSRPAARSSGRLRRRGVLRVGHEVTPLTLGTAAVRSLPDRQMRHEAVGCGPVPMPLARRGVDSVARADLEDLATP
jgi:hypothetical protein